MGDLIMVTTTVDEEEDAIRLARLLVTERLAACVQIKGAVTSVYRWQGQIEETQEYCLTIKTDARFFETIAAVFETYHPYEIPEIIATPISHCSAKFAQWLQGELQDV